VSEAAGVVESGLVCLRGVRRRVGGDGSDLISIGVDVSASVEQQRDGFTKAMVGSVVETGPDLPEVRVRREEK
jgi:hypothetical protein